MMTVENDDSLKSSEEYIMRLLQTIGSLDSMVRSLRDELTCLREKEAEYDLERKRLMKLIEAKDGITSAWPGRWRNSLAR